MAVLPDQRLGPLLAWGGGALVPLVLWALGGGWAAPPGRGAGGPAVRIVAQGAGLVGMALLSVSFVLSTRLRRVEAYFGGLDGMYREHHRLGVAAVGLLTLHALAIAARFVPHDLGRAVGMLLPVHARWAVDLGVLAFWGLLLLVAVTFTAGVPYDTWKLTHKGLGLVLLGGVAHTLLLESTPGQRVAVAEQSALRLYMGVLMALGLAGAVYTIVVRPLRPGVRYTVSAVHRLNEDVMEVELSPRDAPLTAEPGQFVFVTFRDDPLSRESHPYTLCGPADDPALRISVKALGDYTNRLYDCLEAGVEARLDGPYGRFDYRVGGDRQVWIAGGVGIAPFLGWARNLDGDGPRTVALYYCVHDRTDAVYRREFEALARRHPNVTVALVCSVEEGHLRAEDVGPVEDTDIFMCGPQRLTRDLRRQFRRRGVPDRRIHFEDFEFR